MEEGEGKGSRRRGMEERKEMVGEEGGWRWGKRRKRRIEMSGEEC